MHNTRNLQSDTLYAPLGLERQLLATMAEALGLKLVISGGLSVEHLYRVMQFVDRYIEHPIKVRQLAALADLSPSYFGRAFGVSVGMPPREYIARKRLRLAQALMLDTNESLTEIAFRCGLSDHSHLTRLFTHRTGKSPSQWRNDSKVGYLSISTTYRRIGGATPDRGRPPAGDDRDSCL